MKRNTFILVNCIYLEKEHRHSHCDNTESGQSSQPLGLFPLTRWGVRVPLFLPHPFGVIIFIDSRILFFFPKSEYLQKTIFLSEAQLEVHPTLRNV